MKKKTKTGKKIYLIILFAVAVVSFIYIYSNQKSLKKEESRFSKTTTNYIENMKFTDTGINLTIKMKSEVIPHFELCQKKQCIPYELEDKGNSTYQQKLNINDLKNGSYEVYIGTDKIEKVVDTRKTVEKIQRAKIENKLLTVEYIDDKVSLKIEDFKYDYDILIDPGHGGSDIGSYNKYINEEKLNFEQSIYEKKRYEEHGLKVKMIREDKSYGIQMGDKEWSPVRKRAFALGYYGVISKVVYSNHHNSSEYKTVSGWEIIVPSSINNENLIPEKKVAESWEKQYKVLEKHVRFYARKESDGEMLSRRNKEIYNFKDYYAVIRLPGELFQVKNILYEGCYLSNTLDFDWYYTKGNWKKLSESKIKAYVEYLGKKYIPPKS